MKNTRLAKFSKKHLCFDALRSSLSLCFKNISDSRVQGRTQYSLRDSMMSAFACMFFQDASVAEFQRQVQLELLH